MGTRDDDPLAATEPGQGETPRPVRAATPMAETLVDTGDGAQRTSSTGIAPGTKIGRFTVIEKLGQGGMGVVMAAYDPELDRRVAIKMLHDHISAATARGSSARPRRWRSSAIPTS